MATVEQTLASFETSSLQMNNAMKLIAERLGDADKPNGLVVLDSTGKIKTEQLPATTNNVTPATATTYGGLKVSLVGTTLTITA